jgi:hypothetical protein
LEAFTMSNAIHVLLGVMQRLKLKRCR